MADTKEAHDKKYDTMAISRRAANMVRSESKKSGRKIYVEVELLIEEAIGARREAQGSEKK